MAQALEKQGVDYDEILSKVGHFGTFQKIILFLLSFCSAAGGLVVVVFPFTAYQQQYRWQPETIIHTYKHRFIMCMYDPGRNILL